MKRLDINNGRSILFPAVNIDRAGLAQRDSNDTGRRICTKEDRVFLEFHFLHKPSVIPSEVEESLTVSRTELD
jgi:hypothetical protein